MKLNPLKHKLKNFEQTYGCWITLAHPLLPEILAPAGFDWLTVDMEHSSVDLGDLLPLLMSIEANAMIPLVRVGEHDPNLIKRVMDAGAYGVIVADVRTAQAARDMVNAMRYPPFGTRGVGLYRAQGFGKRFEEYLTWLQNESVLIVQIEHIAAVDQIDDIFRVEGVDAFMIGPYDLSGSLGLPGQFEHPKVKSAIDTILQAGKKHGIPAGFHSVSSSAQEAAVRREQGFVFLGFSLDSIFLGDAAMQAMRKLKS